MSSVHPWRPVHRAELIPRTSGWHPPIGRNSVLCLSWRRHRRTALLISWSRYRPTTHPSPTFCLPTYPSPTSCLPSIRLRICLSLSSFLSAALILPACAFATPYCLPYVAPSKSVILLRDLCHCILLCLNACTSIFCGGQEGAVEGKEEGKDGKRPHQPNQVTRMLKCMHYPDLRPAIFCCVLPCFVSLLLSFLCSSDSICNP